MTKASTDALSCGRHTLDLSKPKIMGVLNVTPDSFSDGGRYFRNGRLDPQLALERAQAMVEEGAALIDVGGESTRPGAVPVPLDEEIARVVPLVERIAAELDAVVSVDTSSPEVMTAAASAGAGLLNDVRALLRPGALDAAAATGLPVCLMHMQGEPDTMQRAPQYADVVDEVVDFLRRRIEQAREAGVEQVLVDPGFGFGKTLQHNLQLLGGLGRLRTLNSPVLVGLSRKSMIARILGDDSIDRTVASVVLALQAVDRGASIVRVHDVAETAQALAMVNAINELP